MVRRALFVGLQLLALGLAAPDAQAGPTRPSAAADRKAAAEKKAAARDLANKGWDLYNAGKYEEASEAFQQAEQTYHAPTLVWAQAKAKLKAGKLIESRALYQHLLAEKLDAKAPVEFKGAQETAKDELAALEPRIPTYQVSVRGAAGRAATLKIDGVESPAELDQPIAINPGTYRFEVVLKDGASSAKTVDIKEGSHERVELDFTPPPPTTAPVAPPPPKRGSIAPAAISLGVGAVGIGVGAATGILTLTRAGEIKTHCAGTHCSPDQEAAASTAKTFGNISTVAFAVAGAGVALGVTLLVVRAKAKPAAEASGASIDLTLGPGMLGAKGAF